MMVAHVSMLSVKYAIHMYVHTYVAMYYYEYNATCYEILYACTVESTNFINLKARSCSTQTQCRKQQKLSGRKLMWFLQIFDESRKFFLLIDRCRVVDIIMEAKLQRFSQNFHKSYQTMKLFSHLTFVGCGKCFRLYLQYNVVLLCCL